MRAITAIAVVAVLALAGCAAITKPTDPPSIPGVQISSEERAACVAQGCTVWTDEELKGLAQRAFMMGLQQGRQRSL